MTTIVSVPIFLAHGVHTTEDIPQILGISREKRSTTIQLNGNDVTLVYAEPLGVDQHVADLSYKRVMEALD